MRHLPNLKDLATAEIREILDRAARIKASPKDYSNLLANRTMAMLFQKTSTRTRVSFEAGMTELGGHAIYIDWMTSNFVLSGIEYEAEYLSRNVSCIMARLMHHEDLLKIMSASHVPVINGCDEKFHPCQALTDILTISEHFEGDIAEAHLVYVGVQNNVSNSLVTICNKLGMQLTIATPEDDDNGESLDAEVQEAVSNASQIEHTSDVNAAVQDADFVYTDTWIDMQYFNNPEYTDMKEARIKQMLPYQLNEQLLAGLSCRIMHDMPIHEGYEISAGLVHDPRSVIFDQAENRLHAQKGLLWWLYEEAGLID
jgi:ornithine carbamoyltransferase